MHRRRPGSPRQLGRILGRGDNDEGCAARPEHARTVGTERCTARDGRDAGRRRVGGQVGDGDRLPEPVLGPAAFPWGSQGVSEPPLAAGSAATVRITPERRVPKAGTLRGAGRTHGTCPAVPAGCAGLHTPHCTPAACRVAQRFLPPATRPQRSRQRWGQRGQRRLHPPLPSSCTSRSKTHPGDEEGGKEGGGWGVTLCPQGGDTGRTPRRRGPAVTWRPDLAAAAQGERGMSSGRGARGRAPTHLLALPTCRWLASPRRRSASRSCSPLPG